VEVQAPDMPFSVQIMLQCCIVKGENICGFNTIFIIMFYVFLLLCMFRSVYSVSLCFSAYCLCVNVYCTAATGCLCVNVYCTAATGC
jgi:hypothetical protein